MIINWLWLAELGRVTAIQEKIPVRPLGLRLLLGVEQNGILLQVEIGEGLSLLSLHFPLVELLLLALNAVAAVVGEVVLPVHPILDALNQVDWLVVEDQIVLTHEPGLVAARVVC